MIPLSSRDTPSRNSIATSALCRPWPLDRTADRAGRRGWPRPWIDAILLLLLPLGMLILVHHYVTREHTIYVYDSYFWPAKTQQIAHHIGATLGSPSVTAVVALIREIWTSTVDDYNYLYALPLTPPLLLFGDSREAYVSSVTLLYVLPLSLSVGLLALLAFPFAPRAAFWLGTLVTLSLPPLWAATLRGYPDAGGALLIMLALIMYTLALRYRGARYLLFTGAALAMAVLFRRHFAYAVAALLAAIVLESLLRAAPLLRKPALAGATLARDARRLAWIVGGGGAVLLVVGAPLLYRLLTIDYESEFGVFLNSPWYTAWYYGTRYGWIAWAAAGLGLAWVIWRRAWPSSVPLLVALSGGIAALLWTLQAKQVGVHYGLHFIPFIAIGIVGLILIAYTTFSGPLRVLTFSSIGLYLVVNAAVALGLTNVAENVPARGLLAAQYRPLVRSDYDEVMRIVSVLRDMTRPGDPVYVLATSSAMNFHTLVSAEQTAFGVQRHLQFLGGLFHSPALSNLYQAQFVVTAMPNQDPGPQGCVAFLDASIDALTRGTGIGADFAMLPIEFHLGEGDGYPQGITRNRVGEPHAENGVSVHIYQRQRETKPETVLSMLSDFRRGASQCGEGDGGWAIFSRTPSWAYIDRYDTYEFRSTDFRRGQGPAIFTDLGTVGNGIRGRVDFRGEGCAAPEIRALRADADYAVKEGDLLHTDGAGAFRLASSTAEGDNERLLLQVGDESSDTALPPYCATRIQIEKPAPKERGLATFASKLAEVIRVRAGLSR